MIYLQKRVIDQNGRSPSSTENSKIRCGMTDKKIRASAAWQVGDWYQAGLGEPKNPALATQWCQRSARLGNPHASYRLGLMCQEQHQGKLASDFLDWFELAAKQDHADAQLVLAR